MKWSFGLMLLSSCAAIPSASADEACRRIFRDWAAAADRCNFGPASADPSVCEIAYSYDDDELSSCLAWMKSCECAELDNDQFYAHCGKAISFRTW